MGLFSSIKKVIKKTSPTYHITKKSADFTKQLWNKHTGVTAANAQIAAAEELARQQQEALNRQLEKSKEDARKARVAAAQASTFDKSQKESGVGDVVLGSDNVEADLDEQLSKLRNMRGA